MNPYYDLLADIVRLIREAESRNARTVPIEALTNLVLDECADPKPLRHPHPEELGRADGALGGAEAPRTGFGGTSRQVDT